MSRNLTAGVITEINAAELRPILLFQGDFTTGTVRAWSGYGDLSWNGQTWTGTGNLLTVSAIQEAAETVANGASITLSGIPSELISLALGSVRQGANGKIYLGFLTTANAVISDPVLVFEGRLDVPIIEENGETATIAIAYESRLIDLERPRESRYTDQDQKRVYPGDRGFEFVAKLQDQVVVWGRAS